ncbi:Mannosyl-oligosaccharide 1,2-alpha-mannosidase 1 [Colletotrichum plurivorum]|uniref:alpha-1,2-Mannosidase n=1 Tax=Colletotrichum plurivorum TaxID=2175906 RepID=A0A8H6K6H8_9PEZI|nr:Mannosyl-oligosaccharide 1,2-alpha-mannosidase 1 [Colletotrichum plurivorum]
MWYSRTTRGRSSFADSNDSKTADSIGDDVRRARWSTQMRRNSDRLRCRIRNVLMLLGSTVLASLLLAGYFADNALTLPDQTVQSQAIDWNARREEVRDAFVTSWDAYAKYAWGKDVFHPLSKKGENMSPTGLGWIIVDSLDTMMLMDLTEPLADAREWLDRSLTWDQDQDVNTFEATIRMLGGLLSAHYLSTRMPHVSSRRDSVYLDKAVDLADRLLAAFESESGIPYASVNIGTKEGIPSDANGGSSYTAEAATLQLEMKYLSHLTGNDVSWKKAERVMKVLDDQKTEGGLLPIFVHPSHGRFTTREIRLGVQSGSYYDYLIKQYLQTGEVIYRDMWEDALAGIRKNVVVSAQNSGVKFIAELPQGVGGRLWPKMDHHVCFLPGTIAMATTEGRTLEEARRDSNWTDSREKDVQLAIELTNTCWGMYAVTVTGLAPEITWFNATEDDLHPIPEERPLRAPSNTVSEWEKDFIVQPRGAHNLQSPETVESLFMMYRITGDSTYRERGWKIFEAFREHTRAPDGEGYTSLDDVQTVPPPMRDSLESSWLAETLKYLYLLFSPEDYMLLTEVVFNTGAHPFPRFTPQGSLNTSWERVPRSTALERWNMAGKRSHLLKDR